MRVAVIADDLTGANGTGVLLVKRGFRAETLLGLPALPTGDGILARDDVSSGSGLHAGGAAYEGADALLLTTDSRALPPGDAYAAVQAGARRLLGARLLAKRMDSTLRGNLGAEVDALLDFLPDAVAVVCAAFPASGRTTVGGRQYLHGVPVEETAARHDPFFPVTDGDVANAFRRQSRYPVAYRPSGAPWPDGARIIVCDAATDADVEALAAEVAAAPFRAVPVDPGPFTAALAAAVHGMGSRGASDANAAAHAGLSVPPGQASIASAPGRPVLVVAGSRSPQTQAQLGGLPLLSFDPATSTPEETARQVATQPGPVIGVIATGALLPGGGAAVAEALGRIAAQVLTVRPCAGLYTTGGDVTVAVCRALGATSFELLGEVMPLAAHGLLRGGSHDGLPMVTKGGLVGGDDAAQRCLAALQGRP